MLPYRKKLLALILFVAVAVAAFAEAGGDTNRVVYYQQQYAKLHEKYLKSPDDIANITALAYFYSEPDNPMRNLPLAMDYIKISESRYKELVGDRSRYREVNKLIRKGITLVELRQRRQMIADEARKSVKQGLKPEEIEPYLRAFSGDIVICKDIAKQKSAYSYSKAIELNTEKAYKDFLDNNPNAAERDDVTGYLKALLAEKIANASTENEVDAIVAEYNYEEIRKVGENRKCELCYRKACEENTPEAYRTFLRRFPSSEKYDKVLTALDSLALKEFKTLRTPCQYADFAEKYSELSQSEQAVDSIVKMIVEDLNDGALRIYLDEFSTDANYNEVYKSYYLRYSREGNAAPIQLFEKQNPDFPLKFLIAEDLATAQEIEKIDFLKPFDETATAFYSDRLKMFMGKGINYVLLLRLIQPYIVKGNMAKANALMSKYELCFSNDQSVYYNKLKKLLAESAKAKPVQVFAPRHSITHPQLVSSGVMYVNKKYNLRTEVLAVDTRKNSAEEKEILFDTTGVTFFSISNDEKKMLVGIGGDIFTAEKDDTIWKVRDPGIENLNTVLYYEGDAVMTPDGMGMLFVSDRRGGYNVNPSGCLYHGDTNMATDIYYMPRKGNGWGAPINLGPVVNTPFSERSPVLSKDLTTMYFTSDRNGGLGFYDIYMTTRTDLDSWTKWSEPVNIGKIANTPFSEFTVSLTPDESQLYFTSNTANYLRQSVYKAKASHVRGNFLKTVSINLKKVNNENGIAVDVTDYPGKTILHKYNVTDTLQSLTFDVLSKKEYVITCWAEGCFVPDEYMSKETVSIAPKAYNVMSALSQKTHIPLSSVRFKGKTATLSDVSEIQMQHLADFLRKNPTLRVEIINNVSGGSVADDYELSLKRSETMKNILMSKGIDQSRIVASGFGNINYKKNTNVNSVEIVLF